MYRQVKTITKTKESKTTTQAVKDIEEAYEIWLKQKVDKHNRTYHITITNTSAKHEQDLHFMITNRLFNRIHKETRETTQYLNYLFVIEYPETISRGNYLPNKCDVHAHIVVNTDIGYWTLFYYLHDTFGGKTDIQIDDTTTRTDKAKFVNYLTKQAKQNNFLSDRNYNYKITL